MSTKILIAPDSFKGCADSVSLAVLIQNELKEIKNFEFEITPISDGGDGFLNVCKNNFQLEEVEYYISTPFDETMMKCKVGYDRLNKSIFIESADVLGLKVIPIQKRKPLKLSSKGLGELILKIKYDVESKKLSCDKIYLGIGGTGTVDFGLGMCSIFGLKIFMTNNWKCYLKIIFELARLIFQNSIYHFKLFLLLTLIIPCSGKMELLQILHRRKG